MHDDGPVEGAALTSVRRVDGPACANLCVATATFVDHGHGSVSTVTYACPATPTASPSYVEATITIPVWPTAPVWPSDYMPSGGVTGTATTATGIATTYV